MKLSSSLALIAAANAACPSTECWTEEADGSCTLKDAATCGYSVSCDSTGMTVNFNDDLFDSDDSTDFNSGSGSCAVDSSGANTNQFTSALGSCGMSVAKEGTGADRRIVFSKTLSVGGAPAANAFNSNGDAISLFLENFASTSVTFKCKFPLTATATSDAVTVTQDQAISATAEGDGDWAGAFTLKFMDSLYLTEIDPKETNIGENLYPQAVMAAPIAVLDWYISDCEVTANPALGQILPIVKESCFAELVQAGWGGGNTGAPDTDKKAADRASFKERSRIKLIHSYKRQTNYS